MGQLWTFHEFKPYGSISRVSEGFINDLKELYYIGTIFLIFSYFLPVFPLVFKNNILGIDLNGRGWELINGFGGNNALFRFPAPDLWNEENIKPELF